MVRGLITPLRLVRVSFLDARDVRNENGRRLGVRDGPFDRRPIRLAVRQISVACEGTNVERFELGDERIFVEASVRLLLGYSDYQNASDRATVKSVIRPSRDYSG